MPWGGVSHLVSSHWDPKPHIAGYECSAHRAVWARSGYVDQQCFQLLFCKRSIVINLGLCSNHWWNCCLLSVFFAWSVFLVLLSSGLCQSFGSGCHFANLIVLPFGVTFVPLWRVLLFGFLLRCLYFSLSYVVLFFVAPSLCSSYVLLLWWRLSSSFVLWLCSCSHDWQCCYCWCWCCGCFCFG